METEREPRAWQAMGDETMTGCSLKAGKKRLTGKMEGTRIESKAQHTQQEQKDRRQGQQTKTWPKQEPKMPTKALDVPLDVQMTAYGLPNLS